MHNGMIVQPTDVASGSVGMPPLRALGEGPPLAEVAEADRMRGRREHQRARVDHMREHSRIILRVRCDFSDGDVFGGPYEFPELPVCHRIAVHPEAVHGDAVRRSFFGIMLVRSHAESATGYPDHPVALRSTDRDVSFECACREKRCHLARCLPLDRQLAGASYAGALSQAIGPRSNIGAIQLASLGRTFRRLRAWIAARRYWAAVSVCGKIPVDFTQESWTTGGRISSQKTC